MHSTRIVHESTNMTHVLKHAERAPDISSYLHLLSPDPLLAALAAVDDVTDRRYITAQVHAHKIAQWGKDPSFFASEASHLVRDIHGMFRRVFNAVAEECEAGPEDENKWMQSFESYNEMLHHHHSIEDKWWFPRLSTTHPAIKYHLAALELDHKELVALAQGIRAGDRAALREFVVFLEDHLNREEILTVPFLMDGSGGI